MSITAPILTLALLLQGDRALEEVRSSMPMTPARMGERAVQYLRKGDIKRASKVLAMLEDYADAYDRKWKTRLATQLKQRASKAERRDMLEMVFILVYADLHDQLHAIESSKSLRPRAAKQHLLAAKANYTVISPLVRMAKRGTQAHALITQIWITASSRMPRLRDSRSAGSWQRKLVADVKKIQALLEAALPKLTKATEGKEEKPGDSRRNQKDQE